MYIVVKLEEVTLELNSKLIIGKSQVIFLIIQMSKYHPINFKER